MLRIVNEIKNMTKFSRVGWQEAEKEREKGDVALMALVNRLV
jgi:hypothetical protein